MTGAATRRRPAVFLDRDGVLNRPVVRDGRPHPPTSVEQLELYPEVPAACHRLRGLGFALVVVTNQPDVARGQLDAEVVDAINGRLSDEIELDGVYTCPHDDADHCPCRKPAPGLLLSAAFDLGLDRGHSVMVGDRWRDIEAGRRAGCRTVHIDRGYDERAPEDADSVAIDLAEAVRWIEDVVVGEG
ncbi:MAG: HAD family hydrolase [Acidimicrobiales bacterium]|jgi:D-glycero-D-manno-heptose 1,7-bisphosphate phosphatase